MRKLAIEYLNKANPKSLRDNIQWRKWRVIYLVSAAVVVLSSWIITHGINTAETCITESERDFSSEVRYKIPSTTISTYCSSRTDAGEAISVFVVVGVTLVIVGAGYMNLPRLFQYLHPPE